MRWLRSGLLSVGLVEGQDFIFEARWADGDYRRFRELAGELIQQQPAAVIVSTIAAAEAAREVSKTVPIVMTGLNDPVAADTGTLRYMGPRAPPCPQPSEPPNKQGGGEEAEEYVRPHWRSAPVVLHCPLRSSGCS